MQFYSAGQPLHGGRGSLLVRSDIGGIKGALIQAIEFADWVPRG